jgi:hypothetical protein
LPVSDVALSSLGHQAQPKFNAIALRHRAHRSLGAIDVPRRDATVQSRLLLSSFWDSKPKGRLSGPQVNQLFAEGKYREIAQYCADDVRATAELYRRWRELLSFEE